MKKGISKSQSGCGRLKAARRMHTFVKVNARVSIDCSLACALR